MRLALPSHTHLGYIVVAIHLYWLVTFHAPTSTYA